MITTVKHNGRGTAVSTIVDCKDSSAEKSVEIITQGTTRERKTLLL